MSGGDLAQLRDIHLPDAVGLWPLAWGWWLLLALVLLGFTTGIWFWLHRRWQNRYRHQAIAELERALDHYSEHGDIAEYLQELSIVLRRAALSAFPRTRVAGLKGMAWLEFLDATLPGRETDFSQGSGRALLSGPYQAHPQADVEALHRLARRWLSEHRRKPLPDKFTPVAAREVNDA